MTPSPSAPDALRYLSLAILFAVTACQSSLTNASSALPLRVSATQNRMGGATHLYVSVSTASHYPSIERFRLVNGRPQAKPDLVYEGYGGPLAVAGDGTLYVGNVSYKVAVAAFPPNASTPSREITLPNIFRHCHSGSGSGSTFVSSLAADTSGHLFVGIYTYYDAPRRAEITKPSKSKFPWPCEGVAVYAPTAKGKAHPIQSIQYSQASYLLGLAVDSADNLFVDDSTYEVDEFSNAVYDPQKTRVFRGGYVGYAHAIATDARDNLFIASTGASYKSGRIERYATDASGYGKPKGTITLSSGVHLLEAIAASKRVLYVDDVGSSVDLYHSRENGNQTPFYSLPATNIVSVATGP